ncbi:hypothetical protein BT63DRAFT_451712 [Microthyrium microscopicum]|uniref:Sin3-associated polypeptide Sap18 n=1 Tax=Microthyrium microscopicum TaxID=703497 RepID=A0A6A6UMZ9_9PEZI|nr:hypothetical protein BT63DRAFT_451712 [Microthyrium microscopicum]
MAELPPIDRQTTTPFLLRLFYRNGSFHRPDEFAPNSSLPQHVQIYTWPTCSLKELTQLLTTAIPSTLPSPSVGTRLCFRLMYPNTHSVGQGAGRYLIKEVGTVVIGSEDAQEDAPIAERLEGDPEKTLRDVRFVIGDYVSCAILPPLPNGDVAPIPARGPGPRPPPTVPRGENGFGGGYGGGGRRGSGRFDGGRVPQGEWRRGDVPPPSMGGYGDRGGGGRGRGRGRGW